MATNNLAFNNAFCPLLFIQQHINTRKEMQVCCFSAEWGKIADHHNFNSDEYKAIRDSSLHNEWPKQCLVCKKSEEAKKISPRQVAVRDFLPHQELVDKQVELHKAGNDIQPYYYDLRISNLCNLMCQTCGPANSSSIAKSLNKDNPFFTLEPDIDINPNAIKMYLAGGEPFMIKQFINLLNKVENLDCEIVVNTNGTIVNENILEALKRFKQVNITLSLDGFGTVNDQIRKGSKWDLIVKNIQVFKECGFSIHATTVLQKDNINKLYDLGKFLEEQDINMWTLVELHGPEEFKWIHATLDKNEIKRTLDLNIAKKNIGLSILLNKIVK